MSRSEKPVAEQLVKTFPLFFRFYYQNFVSFLFSPMDGTCADHPILLGMIILTLLGQEYKS
jgi:hypothetical protein